MLNMSKTQKTIDLIHGPIIYSGLEREIIGTPFFNRLHRILQSSLVYMTYPSNKCKRFEHSIGTMHLAGNFFFNSICNSTANNLDKFFLEVNQKLISWNSSIDYSEVHYIHKSVLQKYKKIKILTAPVPDSVFYRQNTPTNLKQEYMFSYRVVFQAVRLVGLLHDVGHLPYSHILEQGLKLLYYRVKTIKEEEQNESHKRFLSIMGKYCENSKFEIHEELGIIFVNKIFDSIIDELPRCENEQYYFLAAVMYFTRSILNAEEGGGKNNIFSDLHSIVAGTLDCDRMDYCCRDRYCSGVSKELPNYDRIFSSVQIIYREVDKPTFAEPLGTERDRCIFAPSTKAITQIETLLEHRWEIYTNINYHHRVHKYELLLKEAIAELGMHEMGEGEPSEELEHTLPLKISSIWQLISQMDSPTSIEYIALQLDDSWLDTLLKHKYFDKYKESYLSIAENGNDTNWHRLDELISAKKHYYSLIKRAGGFRSFDELFFKSFLLLDKDSYFAEKYCLISKDNKTYSQFIKNGEYSLNRLIQTIAPTSNLRTVFFTQLEEVLRSFMKKNKTKLHVEDCMVSDCTFKLGISQSDPLYITDIDKEPKPFFHYSPLYEVLMSKKSFSTSFHIYVLPEYDIAHSEYYLLDIPKLQSAVAEIIAEEVIARIK